MSLKGALVTPSSMCETWPSCYKGWNQVVVSFRCQSFSGLFQKTGVPQNQPVYHNFPNQNCKIWGRWLYNYKYKTTINISKKNILQKHHMRCLNPILWLVASTCFMVKSWMIVPFPALDKLRLPAPSRKHVLKIKTYGFPGHLSGCTKLLVGKINS